LQAKEKGMRANLRKKASAGLRASDRLAISRIWAATKDYYAKDEGLTGKELMDATARKVESIVARTQPTADALNQTLLQSQKDFISRNLSLFSSQRSKMNNMILQPTIARMNAETKAEKSAATTGMVKAFLVYGMSQGLAMSGIDLVKRKGLQAVWLKIAKMFNPDIGEVKDPVTVQEQMNEAAVRSFIGMFPAGREIWTVGKGIKDRKNIGEILRSGRLDGALNSAASDMAKGIDSWFSEDDITEKVFNTLVASDRILGIGYSVPAKIAHDAMNAAEKVVYLQDNGVRTMIDRYKDGDADRNEVREYIKFIVPNDKKRQLKYINKLNSAIKAEKKKSVEK